MAGFGFGTALKSVPEIEFCFETDPNHAGSDETCENQADEFLKLFDAVYKVLSRIRHQLFERVTCQTRKPQ